MGSGFVGCSAALGGVLEGGVWCFEVEMGELMIGQVRFPPMLSATDGTTSLFDFTARRDILPRLRDKTKIELEVWLVSLKLT